MYCPLRGPICLDRLAQVLIENKSKFVLVHASSGHKHAVEEILSQPAVQSRLADTKASEEIRALATFFDMLKKDPDRAYYGYNVRERGGGLERLGEGERCRGTAL